MGSPDSDIYSGGQLPSSYGDLCVGHHPAALHPFESNIPELCAKCMGCGDFYGTRLNKSNLNFWSLRILSPKKI